MTHKKTRRQTTKQPKWIKWTGDSVTQCPAERESGRDGGREREQLNPNCCDGTRVKIRFVSFLIWICFGPVRRDRQIYRKSHPSSMFLKRAHTQTFEMVTQSKRILNRASHLKPTKSLVFSEYSFVCFALLSFVFVIFFLFWCFSLSGVCNPHWISPYRIVLI